MAKKLSNRPNKYSVINSVLAARMVSFRRSMLIFSLLLFTLAYHKCNLVAPANKPTDDVQESDTNPQWEEIKDSSQSSNTQTPGDAREVSEPLHGKLSSREIRDSRDDEHSDIPVRNKRSESAANIQKADEKKLAAESTPNKTKSAIIPAVISIFLVGPFICICAYVFLCTSVNCFKAAKDRIKRRKEEKPQTKAEVEEERVALLEDAEKSHEGRKEKQASRKSSVIQSPLNAKPSGLNAQHSELKVQHSGLTAQISRPNAQNSALKDQPAVLKSQHSGLKTQLSGLKTQLSGLKTQLSGLSSDNARILEQSNTPLPSHE